MNQMAEARKKILCIEDDRETAKLIANELSERGFYALIAYEAPVGLAAILKRIPDLVLCDVGLPEMSGFEILAAVNGSLPRFNRIPFIFLTGWASRHDQLRGRSLGADDYLTKPIDFDILEEVIRARLINGVVRHEVVPGVPRPAPRPATVKRRASSSNAARERIVELSHAPTVDLKLDDATSIGTAGHSDGAPIDPLRPITEP